MKLVAVVNREPVRMARENGTRGDVVVHQHRVGDEVVLDRDEHAVIRTNSRAGAEHTRHLKQTAGKIAQHVKMRPAAVHGADLHFWRCAHDRPEAETHRGVVVGRLGKLQGTIGIRIVQRPVDVWGGPEVTKARREVERRRVPPRGALRVAHVEDHAFDRREARRRRLRSGLLARHGPTSPPTGADTRHARRAA